MPMTVTNNSEVTVKYVPNDRQKEFHSRNETEVVYGGA